MCAENVERLIAIDCWSPMSASRRSNTGSTARAAGGRRPDWCRSAATPSVFSATVLPPVFGPLMTSARRSPRSRSIGTAVAGSSRGCLAPSSRTSSDGSTGAPRQRRDSVPHASARSSSPDASTSAVNARALAPAEAERSPRIRSASSRSAPAASDWRLLSSTISNGSTKSVCPEPDESWTMPCTLRRALALSASTGRPPRWVTKSSCRYSRIPGARASCRSSSTTVWRNPRSSLRRRRRRGEAPSRRSEPSSSTQRSISFASGARSRSIASAISCRSGARSAASSSAACARRPPVIVVEIRRSASGPSTPPRAACSAAARTSWIPSSGGSAETSMSAIASAVSACRRATSSASADGTSACASSSPCGVAVTFASRPTSAGNSSASSVASSTRRVYDRSGQAPRFRRLTARRRSSTPWPQGFV